MQKKNIKPLGRGGNVDKTQTIETVAKDMRTGNEISRSAATYTTGTPKAKSQAPTSVNGGAAGPVQRMTDQLKSKQYEQNNRKGSTLVHKRSSRG